MNQDPHCAMLAKWLVSSDPSFRDISQKPILIDRSLERIAGPNETFIPCYWEPTHGLLSASTQRHGYRRAPQGHGGTIQESLLGCTVTRLSIAFKKDHIIDLRERKAT